LSESAVDCSIALCNGHGRCVVETIETSSSNQKLPYSMKLLLASVLPYDTKHKIVCQCYIGFTGDACDHEKSNIS